MGECKEMLCNVCGGSGKLPMLVYCNNCAEDFPFTGELEIPHDCQGQPGILRVHPAYAERALR